MVQELRADDAAEVAFVGELTEHRGRRTAQGIAKVHGVSKVDGQGKTVDNHKEPFTEQLVASTFLLVPGQEHQQDVEGVGVDDGRSVEEQSATEHITHALPKEGGEETGVLSIIRQTRHLIDEIHEQQVPKDCHHRGVYLAENPFHRSFKSFVDACRMALARCMRSWVLAPSSTTTLSLIMS